MRLEPATLETIWSLELVGESFMVRWLDSPLMKATVLLLSSALFLAACSQAINYTYSKKNFTSSNFEVDISACKRHSSPFSAYQEIPRNQQPPSDDAAVRDCMKAKGYKIETEAR
jgi:hypothetical protein